MRVAACVVVFVLVGTMAGLRIRGYEDGGPDAAIFASTFVPASCAFELPEGQLPLAVCGTVEVPQFHDRPTEGVRLKLAIAVFRSTDAAPANDPFVYLQGGPGGATLGVSTWLFSRSAAEPIQGTRDLVFIDQRGTGLSTPHADCVGPGFEEFERAPAPANLEAVLTRVAACRDALGTRGVRSSAFNTSEGARDVVTVLRALGYERWNIYGVSWGTRVAQTLARDVPEGLRSLILDSVAPLNWNIYEDAERAFERSLEQLFEACRSDATCESGHTGLEERFFVRVRALDAEPRTVTVHAAEGIQEQPVRLTGRLLLQAVRLVLYEAGFVPDGPAVLDGVARADWNDELVQRFLRFTVRGPGTLAGGVQLSTLCQEQVSQTRTSLVIRANRELRPELRNERSGIGFQEQERLCKSWLGFTPPGGPEKGVHSLRPALILAGGFDPITAPANAGDVSGSFPRSHALTFAASSHGVLAQGCVMEAVAAFLDSPFAGVRPGCLAEELRRRPTFSE